jgi:hypothetical protein
MPMQTVAQPIQQTQIKELKLTIKVYKSVIFLYFSLPKWKRLEFSCIMIYDVSSETGTTQMNVFEK